MKLEKLFNVNQVQAAHFPGRCTRWVRDTFKGGFYGPVTRDKAGWLISETAIFRYQQLHTPKPDAPPASLRAPQRENLIQNQAN